FDAAHADRGPAPETGAGREERLDALAGVQPDVRVELAEAQLHPVVRPELRPNELLDHRLGAGRAFARRLRLAARGDGRGRQPGEGEQGNRENGDDRQGPAPGWRAGGRAGEWVRSASVHVATLGAGARGDGRNTAAKRRLIRPYGSGPV